MSTTLIKATPTHTPSAFVTRVSSAKEKQSPYIKAARGGCVYCPPSSPAHQSSMRAYEANSSGRMYSSVVFPSCQFAARTKGSTSAAAAENTRGKRDDSIRHAKYSPSARNSA